MDLTSTRRGFLAGVAALLAAPVREFAKPILTPVISAPRKWLWLQESGWMQAPDSLRYFMNITALRSDGQYFYVVAPIYTEDINKPEVLKSSQEYAAFYLNSFLNCSCVLGHTCALHTQPVVELSPEEQTEIDLEVKEIMS